jgi:hypothetical protein
MTRSLLRLRVTPGLAAVAGSLAALCVAAAPAAASQVAGGSIGSVVVTPGSQRPAAPSRTTAPTRRGSASAAAKPASAPKR